jgi:tetratricopeptide (TPR) repeat protein
VDDDFAQNGIPHLRGQFAKARPILFTGAGFSAGARNMLGRDLPTSDALTVLLWEICFPQTPFEPGTSLQDIYQEALMRHKAELKAVLQPELTVDANSVSEWYAKILSLPWFKVYTLNVDDLETAADRVFRLPRRPKAISATALATGVPEGGGAGLDVIHLNGTIQDIPDQVTFSPTQYAERLASPDPWYTWLASEMVTHPVVFMGTRLDEPPLWQHVEMRRLRGMRRLRREYRPRSYLVTPSLNLARQALLDEFHVNWVQMDAKAFAEEVLPLLEPGIAEGHAYIARTASFGLGQKLREVADIATHPDAPSDFLLGAEPIWADLQSGRAIERERDSVTIEQVKGILARTDGSDLVVVMGTAGSGKSVALMRLALSLTADGHRVGWVCRDDTVSPHDIRATMRSDDAPRVLCIDDADLYGSELAPLIVDCVSAPNHPLVAVAVRSPKLGQVLSPARMPGIRRVEFAVEHLTDVDIDRLLDVLDRENRLGVLKGETRIAQRRVFQAKADRQLLVAMIEATSGQRFDQKISSEYDELDPESRFVYACVAVASHFGFSLSRQDLLVASGDRSNEALERLDLLLRSKVVLNASHGIDLVRARHRVVAEHLMTELQHRKMLLEPAAALAVVAASRVNPNGRRTDPEWRFLRAIINHEFLLSVLGRKDAREVYSGIENMLSWDHHYWLQMGSLEVETGNVNLAENFLNQARSLAPEDYNVLTEWAYLLYKKAVMDPSHPDADALAEEARQLLRDLIRRRGDRDQYAYHVYGSQTLAWVGKLIGRPDEVRALLKDAFDVVKEGAARHPYSEKLRSLSNELKRALLATAVTADLDA